MVRRATRFFDLMEKIDYDHPDDPPGDRFGRIRYEKSVPKDAMIQIAERLDIQSGGIKPELRDQIRQDILNRPSNKSPVTILSSNELFRVIRALNHNERLNAVDVDIYDELPQWHGSLVISTEDHDELSVEVFSKGKGAWKWGEPQRYSEYEQYMLADRDFDDGRRRRLMVLRDLNTDECRYNSDVVLERTVDYGPYKHWKRQSYVTEVTVK